MNNYTRFLYRPLQKNSNMKDNIKWDYLEQFFQGPSLNRPGYKNIDQLSILFAKNKNTLQIGHAGMSIGGVGLQVPEALQLAWFTGVMSGYLLYTGSHEDIQILTDKILKRLFEHSKIFGYNKNANFGITITPLNKIN